MITMAVIVEIVVTETMTTPDHPVDMAMVNTILLLVLLISKPPLLIHHTINKTIAITIIIKLKKIIFKKRKQNLLFPIFLKKKIKTKTTF